MSQLLKLGERDARSPAARRVTVNFNGTRFRDYAAITSWQLKQDVHSDLRVAEAEGAISIEWGRRGGDDKPVDRIVLKDIRALSTLLGIELHADKIAVAERELNPLVAIHPRVEEILAAWRSGRTIRGFGTEAAGRIADSARLIEYLCEQPDDSILRRVSALLFDDSKRVEQLTPFLDVLTSDSLYDRARPRREVWAKLGLRKEPRPALFAGAAALALSDGSRLPLVSPYLGLSPIIVTGFHERPAYVLTVENLTSFHELANTCPKRGVVIYTDGMPSPAWRAMYRRLIETLPSDVPLRHWGDIDEGGFRIAAVIAAEARASGRVLGPWRMSPGDIGHGVKARTASPAKAVRMAISAEMAGWHALGSQLRGAKLLLEQERLSVIAPDSLASTA